MTTQTDFSTSRRLYRLLLRLYPEPFRTSHGSEMEEVYIASLLIQLARRGPLGFPVTWVRILWDTAWHAASLRWHLRERRSGHLRWIVQSLAEDARFAARHVQRNRSFTVAAVGTLALGIGLNTAVFGAMYSLLFRPLPGVEEPDQLVQVYRTGGEGAGFLLSSIPLFRDLQADNDVFSGVAAWTLAPLVLGRGDRAERAMGEIVSADFFALLGVRMIRGQGFPIDSVRESPNRRVVVLSERFWRSRLGGDPAVVGKALAINGTKWEVVGIAPASFRGPLPFIAPVLWAPLSMHAAMLRGGDRSDERGNNFLDVIARLEPGVGIGQAKRWANRFAVHLREEHPEYYERTGIQLSPQKDAGPHPALRSALLGFSGIMMGVAGLLLLIACANVAGLFLAKAQFRRKEVAIRRGLGAPRPRLVSQLVIESLLLSLLAGAGGFLLAHVIVVVANRVRLPSDWALEWNVALGTPVIAFTVGVTLLASVLFGLAPAVRSSVPDLVRSLNGSPGSGTRGPARRGRLLVGAQVAVSTVLLVCAGLFAKNLRYAMAIDTGFKPDKLLLATLDPSLQGHRQVPTEDILATVVSRMRAVSGVTSVGLASYVPFQIGGGAQRVVEIPGYQPRAGESMNIHYNSVDSGYFSAMGIPIAQGRGFRESDGDPDGRAVVVNETFADRFWPGQSPLGKVVATNGGVWEVVGVVPTGKYLSLGEEPMPFIYFPWPRCRTLEMIVHIRVSGDPTAMIPLLRREIAAVDPDLQLYDVRTMKDHLGIVLFPARIGAVVVGVFAALCLFLLSIGIHGVVAYTVSRRTQEVGIRIAIGAEPRSVMLKVLREQMRVVTIGVAMGVVGALATSWLVERVLYSKEALDPAVLLTAPVFLLAVAAAASYVPARRAARVDPVQALRSE